MYPLNPKAMSVIELYGVLDPDTRDWTDGILSNIFRAINKPTDKKELRYCPIKKYMFVMGTQIKMGTQKMLSCQRRTSKNSIMMLTENIPIINL